MPALIEHIRPSAKWADGLADKERVFVEEYLIDLNGRQACIRCGYAESSASNDARKMLDKPNVAAAIDKALAERPGITRTRIVDELAKIAFANAGTYSSWDADGVKIISSDDLDDDQKAAVKSIKETRTESDTRSTVTVEYQLHDKVGALERLGKVLRMFVDRQEVSGPNGEPLQVEAVRDRVVGRLERLRKRVEESNDIAAATPVPIEAPAEVVVEGATHAA